MNRNSLTITLVSICLAVGLFVVASLFDDKHYADITMSEPSPSIPRTRQDTEVRSEATLENCQLAETALKRKVDASQHCSTDNDCTLFDYGYPIQCLTSVSESEISALRLQYREYEAQCEYRVYYDCPAGPMERTPVCRENRCEVELSSIDSLQDQTREHIGLDP